MKRKKDSDKKIATKRIKIHINFILNWIMFQRVCEKQTSLKIEILGNNTARRNDKKKINYSKKVQWKRNKFNDNCNFNSFD